jgi:hypothetical protein
MFDKCSDFRIQYIEAKIYVSSLQGTLVDVTIKVEAITSKKKQLTIYPFSYKGGHPAQIFATEAICIIVSMNPLKLKKKQICPP